MFVVPENLRKIYPNPPQYIFGKPGVIFRDHRWTLPVLYMAAEMNLVRLPALIVMFDRHRDSLPPDSSLPYLRDFRNAGGLSELVELVTFRLSSRDDDWLLSGMEAGLISDAVRFGTEPDGMESITRYMDSAKETHRVYHLERPSRELAYQGALTDERHPDVSEGLWDVLGWNPKSRAIEPGSNGMLLDIDLDFFTIAWETFTLPFPEEVYRKEFLEPCQSIFYDDYRPVDFLSALLKAAGAFTIATEPDFCGGARKARRILGDVNRHLLGGGLNDDSALADYQPGYPYS